MAIEAKCRAHAPLAHNLKTHAIYQAQFLARCCKHGAYSSGMLWFGDPFDVEQRYDVFVKSPQCR